MEYWSGKKITYLKENEVFVYGSNPQGINGAGAAKAAMSLSEGAKNGIGRGFNGSNAYALVTKSLNAGVFEKSTGILYDKEGFRSVSPEQIRANVDELYEIAKQSEHKNKKFLVSYQYESWPNGTPKKSLNGYDSQEILEMFAKDKDVPPNIVFHESYKPHLEKLWKNKSSIVNKKIEQPSNSKTYHVLPNLVVISPREKAPEGFIVLNTTSRDTTSFGKSVSPFYLSSIPLYEGMVAKNMENAWQFAKVYPEFVDANNNPTEDYFKWAKKGWDDLYAHRYANGKGNVPLYSYWKTFDEKSQQWIENKWDYIEARKNIYIPLYAKAIVSTQAFKELKNRVLSGEKIALWDFDGYNHATRNMSFEDVLNEPKYKCGHAFVLYGLLTNQLKIINDKLVYDFNLNLNNKNVLNEDSSRVIKINDPLNNLYPSSFTFRNIQFCSLEQFVIYAKAKLCENNSVALDVLKINENKIVKDFLNNTVSSEAIINDKELSQEWMEVQKKLQSMCVKIEESPSQKKSWDLKKENIISVGLREKFIQNPDLKNMLLTKENINVVFSGLCYNNININEILQNLKDWIVIESKSKNKPKM